MWSWRKEKAIEEPRATPLTCVTKRPEVYPRPHITRMWDDYAKRFVWTVLISSRGLHRGTLHANAFDEARRFVGKQNLYGR